MNNYPYHHLYAQRADCIPSKAWIHLAVMIIILLDGPAIHSFDGAMSNYSLTLSIAKSFLNLDSRL